MLGSTNPAKTTAPTEIIRSEPTALRRMLRRPLDMRVVREAFGPALRRAQRISVRTKIIVAAIVVCSSMGAAVGYVGIDGTGVLAQRLETSYAAIVQPLWGATQIDETLDELRLALLRAGFAPGSVSDSAWREIDRLERAMTTSVVKYELEYSIPASPSMQELLAQYGALADQETREQRALRHLHREIPVVRRITGRLRLLTRENGLARPAVDREIALQVQGLKEQVQVLQTLQLELPRGRAACHAVARHLRRLHSNAHGAGALTPDGHRPAGGTAPGVGDRFACAVRPTGSGCTAAQARASGCRHAAWAACRSSTS